MSAKWVRSQKWDDEHLGGVLWPVKVLLRTFSSIPLAIVLLTLVALYGVMASVPVGIIALIPTWAFKGLTLVAAVVILAVLPVWLGARLMARVGVGRAWRFAISTLAVIAMSIGVCYAWSLTLWPAMKYDPTTGRGIQFFSEFVQRYSAVQVRRLPGMEMSELEFYSWWPLSTLLILFVINLVVATVRRIEFSFPYIGVLTVHTGIVVIALGSVYYATHKQEGDMILLAGDDLDESGRPTIGKPETGFYDNTRTALWVTQNKSQGWEYFPLRHVPRYNDYNLGVLPRTDVQPEWVRDLGPIDLRVPTHEEMGTLPSGVVDPKLTYRIVGYASYADLVTQWVSGSTVGEIQGRQTSKLRTLESVTSQTLPDGRPVQPKVWSLVPESAAERYELLDVLGVEYTIGLGDERWNQLAAPIPDNTLHALLVEHPASGYRALYPVQADQSIAVGATGYTLTVKQLLDRPPFPIVTPGYEGAMSSVCIVRVDPPAGVDHAGGAKSFERWLYSRFPGIAQDMLDETNERGMPKRRDPEPGIKITYLDTSIIQTYFDERADGSVRAIVRLPGQQAKVFENLKVGDTVQIAPMLGIKIGKRVDDAIRVEVPNIVPEAARDRQRIGNHQASAIALEVTDSSSGKKATRWVPFSQYLNVNEMGGTTERTITLPDGQAVHVAFGRIRHEFWPPMAVRLQDFEMIPYPHSDTPRDYRSDVVVVPLWEKKPEKPLGEAHKTSLNEPLLVRPPFVADPNLPLIGRWVSRLLNVVAPTQYKFAQAGWDQSTWRQTQQMVEQGQLKRPFARFTILGVGSNPGIYIIATGAVMMSIGIPWAFYLKPWLMQRRKRKIQAELARGGRIGRRTVVQPEREAASNGAARREVERSKAGAES